MRRLFGVAHVGGQRSQSACTTTAAMTLRQSGWGASPGGTRCRRENHEERSAAASPSSLRAWPTRYRGNDSKR